MEQIIISDKHIKEIIQHAKDGYPEEVCGILAGKKDKVIKVFKITNIEHSSVSYFMDSKQQFKAMKECREKGWKMIGIYHSHPEANAYPSDKDVKLAFYEDVAYIIISLKENKPVVKAYEIRNKKIKEINIKLIAK